MPNYFVYITREGLRTKRDRERHAPVNNYVSEALLNVTESSKDKALKLAKRIINFNKTRVFLPTHEIDAFTVPVAKQDAVSIIEDVEAKIEAS